MQADEGGGSMIENGDRAAPAVDPRALSRRAALRKAAVGLGVAGAVWQAPRIEGLSLVPDYASAGTVTGTFMVTVMQIDCGNNIFGDSNCWGACMGTMACQTAVRNFDIGGEPIRITGTGSADRGGDGTLTVDFSTMDPPFNMCMVTAVSGSPGPGIFGQDLVLTGNMVAIDQSPVNEGSNVTFTIVCT
jgi:hypothetical protein